MITTLKKKNRNLLENCHTYALKLFKKCVYLARIGRPDIPWSVNKLARSIIEWTTICDRRLNRLISYIHQNCEYKQCCYVGNTAKQCRLRLFQDSDFAGDLEDSNSTSGGTLCVFGSHTFVSKRWTCKKQTADFHSSTESGTFLWTLDWDWMVLLFLEKFLVFRIDRGNLRLMITNTISLITKLMWWKTLMLFQQMSNPHAKNHCSMCVWGQWSCNQDDYLRQKFHNETRLPNPQSCSWLVDRSN